MNAHDTHDVPAAGNDRGARDIRVARGADADRAGFLERWQARRERTFLERREITSSWFPKLRNRDTRRKLVVFYLILIAAMLASGIALAVGLLSEGGSAWWGAPWAVFTVLLVGTWTTLVIVTDNIDGAPSSVLDEYERERVEGLRSLAYQCFTWFGMILCIGLVFFGTWLLQAEPEWAVAVPYLLGLATLIPYLVILSLPTAIIAWTMPDE
ncbi:hypothetical protein [uncultured Corynebacterium sp.]|uniref:hypothetical protein n=1 Tax=uncultured Corynebacterium sp. TaxID=159447 RepID=UPI0025E9E845|nr:hypothetical protein [uncultured Corynebacterium sp.]